MIAKAWIAFCFVWAVAFFGMVRSALDGYSISGYDWIAGVFIGFAPVFTGLVLWSFERLVASGRWTEPQQ
jgi:hypothetical protein